MKLFTLPIIGWDDNYEYSYCEKTGEHFSTVDGNCDSGRLKQGKGAWLVKNSWGEHAAKYIYLTYASIETNFVEFAYITSLTEMKDKNWDNVYSNGIISGALSKELTQTFEKKHNNQEKIQKIKFHTALINKEYNVSVKINGSTYEISDSFKTDYPGLYTIDVSDKNIYIESGNFDVIITGKESSINGNSISVFTKNVDNQQLIITDEEKDIDSNNFVIYSETRNILSNSKITYELYDGEEKLDGVIKISNNIVSANNVNTEISLIKKIKPGTYKLIQKFEDAKATTTLNVGNILEGAGTLENPYKIYTEKDLLYIYNNLDYHYELQNDIELTEKWIPIGTLENPFTGSFDGRNHKIINLSIDDSTLEYAGLFGYVKDSDTHKTYIKNIYLVNPNIIAGLYTGGLIGGISINQTGENTALIDSIYIIGGSIEGEYANGLIADISGYKKLIINNIFSSATIKGKSHSSLIRFSSSLYNSSNGTSISNIQSIGVMLDNAYDSSLTTTSLINAKYSSYYNISNYISTGYSKKTKAFYDTPIHNIDYNYANNGYALSRTDSFYKFPSIIKTINDITELKNIDKYSEWEDFNSYWEIKEVDGIKRIPVLKGVNLEYTDIIDDISIDYYSNICMSDYITSELINKRLKITTDDDDIIKISEKYNSSEAYPYEIMIIPLKSGTAKIHVISDYDGFEKDINITVYEEEQTITYHDGLNIMTQTVLKSTPVNLIKNTFTKTGYKFMQWNTKEDNSGDPYIDEQGVYLEDDLELYAQWIPIKYRISFNSNTDEVRTRTQTFTYDISSKLDENRFTKEGYKFKEWNTKADGSGKSYGNKEEVKNLATNDNEEITLYAIWEEEYSYIIDKYTVDEDNKYIDFIDVNTSMEDFKKNIKLNLEYTLDVDYKTVNDINVLYTGSKTKIYKNNKIFIEYTNIIRGDVNGDGKINYLDYVSIYNHIQKVKNPTSEKKELKDVYLISSDMNNDSKVNYLDYVKVYNKIKELKGDAN